LYSSLHFVKRSAKVGDYGDPIAKPKPNACS
jgi:hypothetical protein